MPPQMPRPHRRRQIDNRMIKNKRRQRLRNIPKQTLFGGGLLPENSEGHSDGDEDLRAEGVENDEEG